MKAAIDDLEPTGRAEDDTDTLLKIKGNLIYPSFSRWLESDGEKEVSCITIKESQEDNDMHMIVHRNGNTESEVLKAFGGNSKNEFHESERLQACDDKHRKLSLENLFLNYQLFFVQKVCLRYCGSEII